ncbi:MAG: hypothetical protein ABL907_26350 [Hyphomicrobium sp.]
MARLETNTEPVNSISAIEVALPWAGIVSAAIQIFGYTRVVREPAAWLLEWSVQWRAFWNDLISSLPRKIGLSIPPEVAGLIALILFIGSTFVACRSTGNDPAQPYRGRKSLVLTLLVPPLGVVVAYALLIVVVLYVSGLEDSAMFWAAFSPLIVAVAFSWWLLVKQTSAKFASAGLALWVLTFLSAAAALLALSDFSIFPERGDLLTDCKYAEERIGHLPLGLLYYFTLAWGPLLFYWASLRKAAVRMACISAGVVLLLGISEATRSLAGPPAEASATIAATKPPKADCKASEALNWVLKNL